MQAARARFSVRPGSIELIDDGVRSLLAKLPGARDGTGLLNLFVQTPGCALTVNENCDPSVRVDMLAALERLVPASQEAAETRALLYGKSLSLPVVKGQLHFGTWQGTYLCAFSQDAHEAEVTASFVEARGPPGRFTYEARRRGTHPLGEEVMRSLPAEAKGSSGLMLVHELHTSASLAVSAQDEDLEPGMSRIIPEKWNREFFTHTMEGDDDMPGHLKCSLLGCSVVVPVEDGSLGLGTGQGLHLNEHRDIGGWGGGHSRKVCTMFLPSLGPAKSFQHDASRGPAADVTEDVRALVGGADGVVTVFAQSAAVGLAVCSARAAGQLASSIAMENKSSCGSAILGCSLVLPVVEGRLVLEQGMGIFLIGAMPCDVLVLTSPKSAAAL